jgi:hypothetical protein
MRIACCVLIFAALAAAAPARAHHSFGEYYLESDTIEIEGLVVEFQYKNPHSWIQIEGQDPFGRRLIYAAEWGSVSALERQGVLKTTIKPGDRVRVWASPGRNPNDTRVRLKRIQLPDGRTVGGQNRQQERVPGER